MLRAWQVSLGERIDPASDVPIYMQIIQALIRDIERGRLTSGTYLPSSRQLARILGVNRKTVVFAYEDLIAQGWLDSAGTRGTMVAASLPDPVNRHQGEAEATMRSEEHTSELQSLMRISYAVFCLKKKKETTTSRRQRITQQKNQR